MEILHVAAAYEVPDSAGTSNSIWLPSPSVYNSTASVTNVSSSSPSPSAIQTYDPPRHKRHSFTVDASTAIETLATPPVPARELLRLCFELLGAATALVLCALPVVAVTTWFCRYSLSSPRQVKLVAPGVHLGIPLLVVLVLNTPFAVLWACWEWSSCRFSAAVTWAAIIACVAAYAVAPTIHLSPDSHRLTVGFVLGGLMIICSRDFARCCCGGYFRALYLFTLPLLVLLAVIVIYFELVVPWFLDGNTAARLAIRTVMHPLLFTVIIRAMHVLHVTWTPIRSHAHVSSIIVAAGVKLYWGRLFAYYLESLANVAFSSCLLTVAEVAYCLLYRTRRRLYRRIVQRTFGVHRWTALKWRRRATLEIKQQYVLYERVFEVSLIVIAFCQQLFHRVFIADAYSISTKTFIQRAAASMAVQLAFELVGDAVMFTWEVRRLRWGLLNAWREGRAHLFPLAAFVIMLVCGAFWERAMLQVIGLTLRDAVFQF
eukprot:TRINITY_DN3804_c0_g1_i6.p1 TRINITY_DN3804_c0_g1~~TRINITY_DN3804_c0_g1_i6.p1  ORF type:complete len:487 (-),score=70.02 TRINITY_DN3804_c0_g1_i6:78-1538(-)